MIATPTLSRFRAADNVQSYQRLLCISGRAGQDGYYYSFAIRPRPARLYLGLQRHCEACGHALRRRDHDLPRFFDQLGGHLTMQRALTVLLPAKHGDPRAAARRRGAITADGRRRRAGSRTGTGVAAAMADGRVPVSRNTCRGRRQDSGYQRLRPQPIGSPNLRLGCHRPA